MKVVFRACCRRLLMGGVVASLYGVACTTKVPTEPEEEMPAITLGIGSEGVREAFFVGTPLPLVVGLRDSVRFDPTVINFDKGEATFLLPELAEGSLVSELEYRFFWTVTPRCGPDTATGFYFDTITARLGMEQSNPVKVFVKNLPPLIRSLSVGDTSVEVAKHVYGSHVYVFHVDSILHRDSVLLRMALNVYDPDPIDNARLVATWQPRVNEDLIYVESGPPTRGLSAVYRLPETNFTDTVRVTLQDRSTHVVVDVVLFRTGAKGAAHIDSIVVGDSTFVGKRSAYICRVNTMDSVMVRVFSGDRRLTARWAAGSGEIQPVLDAAAPYAARYRCVGANCRGILTQDIVLPLDTVTLTLSTPSGETNSARIIFAKVPTNTRPTIDSVRVGSTALPAALEGGPFEYKTGVGDTIRFVGFYHDDEDPIVDLTVDWQSAKKGRIIEKPLQNMAVYACMTAAYKDTLTFSVTDMLGFVSRRQVILSVVPRPTFDSIAVGDSVYRNMGSPVVHRASLSDTVMIIGHAHAPTGGELVATLSCAGDARTQPVGLFGLRYFAHDDRLYTDTCFIEVRDLAGVATTKAVYLQFVNRRPTIDSIIIDGVGRAVGTLPLTVSASALDTLTIQVQAADADSQALSDVWTTADTANRARLDREGPLTVKYRCLDELYVDTVVVTVTDAFGASRSAAIVIVVNNRAPVLDSVAVGDSVYSWPGGIVTVPRHTAPADSALVMRGYVRDPDMGDVLSVTYRFPVVDRTAQRASEQGYTYLPLADSTYVDTAVVTVEDVRGASETHRVILDFRKP